MLKKVEDDTEKFSFNTAVSSFMIGLNELTDLDCHSKELLQKFLVVLSPYAPHISEELWNAIGCSGSVLDAVYPEVEKEYLIETSKEYPIAINGKTRTTMMLALDITQDQIEQMVMQEPVVQKWLEGKQPKKIIYVKNKMINVVI
ncbi:MAG: class I tRNA ligase family protein [Chitinophagaceae bacterium]|nr:class I tRNA ligase family protein [Chitinophagaceae bacterium]